MKPLGFTLVQMRDPLDATVRLDTEPGPDSGEREVLLKRVREYEQAATEQVDKLRIQLARAEDFAETLRTRLHQAAPAGSPEALR